MYIGSKLPIINETDSSIYFGKQPDGFYSKIYLSSNVKEITGIYIGSCLTMDSTRIYYKGYFNFPQILKDKDSVIRFNLKNIVYSFNNFTFDSTDTNKIIDPMALNPRGKYPLYIIPGLLSLKYSGENLEIKRQYLFFNSAFDKIIFHPKNRHSL